MTKSMCPLLVAATLVACGGDRAPPGTSAVRDSVGLKIAVTDARFVQGADLFATVVDTLALVGSPDDRPGSETLYRVTAARLLDDARFAVLQGGTQLRFYDAEGRRGMVVGRRGNGPGEYALATGLRRATGGGLAVWDAQLARVTVLSSSGELLRSRQLDLEAVARDFPSMLQIRPESRWALLDEDRLLVFIYSFDDMPDEGPSRPRVRYLVLPVEGASAIALGEYGGVEQTSIPGSGGLVVPTLDPEDTYFAAVEGTGHVYVGDGGTSRIDRYDRSGALDLRIELANVDRAPDIERLSRAKARLLEQLDRRGLESMEGHADDMAAGEDAPTFRGLSTDDRHRLWVRWGRQPSPTRVLYAVFDAGGLFVGTVALPPHERILAIASDRIILLHRSALDVETLGVYRFG